MKNIIILGILTILFIFVDCKTTKSIDKYPITDCETFKKNAIKHWKYNSKEKYYKCDAYLLAVFRKENMITICTNGMDTTAWIKIFGKPTHVDAPILHYCLCENCHVTGMPIKELWVTYIGTKIDRVELIEWTLIE